MALVVVAVVVIVTIILVVAIGGAAKSVIEAQPTTTSSASKSSSSDSDSGEDEPKAEKARIGEAFPFEGRSGSGTITVVSSKWVTKGLVDPESGNYLILDVRVEGTEGKVSYNPLYFKVKDSEGREYNIAFGADAEPSLKSGDLEEGDRARGFVAFDVKKGKLKLTVTDELLQDAASIDIPA